MSENIADTLKEVASRFGERIGLIEARTGNSLTFAELDHSADQYCSYFAEQGVRPQERVMLMVRPSAEFISLAFGLFRLGAPVILIDPGMGYKNLLRCIENVKPDYLIGVPPVLLVKALFRKPFRSVQKSFCCGSFLGLTGPDIRTEIKKKRETVQPFVPEEDSLAAIIFTTGSTGPPKGVRFEHSVFAAQLKLIRQHYRIGPEDTDQPGFPLFALFSTAMGACAVIPDMDPTRPAQVDPAKFVASIDRYQVSYSFGSPAIWNVVSEYCLTRNKRCPSLRKVLMAGAPVSGDLIDRVYKIMHPEGQIFTPYGATESLPVVSIEGKEVLQQTWGRTMAGQGTCVGRPLPGVALKIIEVSNGNIDTIEQAVELPAGSIGEIIVKGDVVTRAYENNVNETRMSKISEGGRFWHRVGDMGYLDRQGRLWFCGRKAHRVRSRGGMMYTIPCEAIFNTHPEVFRSALVGADQGDGYENPVLIVEKTKGSRIDDNQLLHELREIGARHDLTESIELFLIHPAFPVDIRHNAKIFREQLKIWAQGKVG